MSKEKGYNTWSSPTPLLLHVIRTRTGVLCAGMVISKIQQQNLPYLLSNSLSKQIFRIGSQIALWTLTRMKGGCTTRFPYQCHSGCWSSEDCKELNTKYKSYFRSLLFKVSINAFIVGYKSSLPPFSGCFDHCEEENFKNGRDFRWRLSKGTLREEAKERKGEEDVFYCHYCRKWFWWIHGQHWKGI